MSCDIYEKKTVTTRKPHVCVYCGRRIERHTPGVVVESGLFEREFFRRYACSRCAPMVGESWDYMGGECYCFLTDWREFLKECHPELIKDDDDGN